jgi:hypothetical protein
MTSVNFSVKDSTIQPPQSHRKERVAEGLLRTARNGKGIIVIEDALVIEPNLDLLGKYSNGEMVLTASRSQFLLGSLSNPNQMDVSGQTLLLECREGILVVSSIRQLPRMKDKQAIEAKGINPSI